MVHALLSLPSLLVYVALFGVIAGESAGLPLPGETSLIAAGVLSSQHGSVSIGYVIAVAAVAAIVGDNVGFVFGRHGGRWLLTREGRWLDARERFLERGERFFARHGPKAIFLARWIPGLRVVGAWLAGAHRVPWRTFLLWNALGGIAWALSVGLAAYVLGHAAGRIFATVGVAGAVLIVVVVAATVGWRMTRGRRERNAKRVQEDVR